jgi:hypothetical protein
MAPSCVEHLLAGIIVDNRLDSGPWDGTTPGVVGYSLARARRHPYDPSWSSTATGPESGYCAAAPLLARPQRPTAPLSPTI